MDLGTFVANRMWESIKAHKDNINIICNQKLGFNNNKYMEKKIIPYLLVTGIKPVAGEYDGSDLSTVIKFEADKYYSKDELVEMAKEMDIDQFNDGAAFPHFINIVISDDRPCLEDFGSIGGILIDAAAFLRYLIECFDNPDKLQEAQEKGYIVDVTYNNDLNYS